MKKVIPMLLVALSVAACGGKSQSSGETMGAPSDSANAAAPAQGAGSMADTSQAGGTNPDTSGAMRDTSSTDGGTGHI